MKILSNSFISPAIPDVWYLSASTVFFLFNSHLILLSHILKLMAYRINHKWLCLHMIHTLLWTMDCRLQWLVYKNVPSANKINYIVWPNMWVKPYLHLVSLDRTGLFPNLDQYVIFLLLLEWCIYTPHSLKFLEKSYIIACPHIWGFTWLLHTLLGGWEKFLSFYTV